MGTVEVNAIHEFLKRSLTVGEYMELLSVMGRTVTELQEKRKTEYTVTPEKTGKIYFQCFECGKTSVYPARTADGRSCAHCGGHIKAIGYAKAVKRYGE